MSAQFSPPNGGGSGGGFPGVGNVVYWSRSATAEEWVSWAALGSGWITLDPVVSSYRTIGGPGLTDYVLPPSYVQSSATLAIDVATLQTLHCVDLEVGVSGGGGAVTSPASAYLQSGEHDDAALSGSFYAGPASYIALYGASLVADTISLHPGVTWSTAGSITITLSGAAAGTTAVINSLTFDVSTPGAGGTFRLSNSPNVSTIYVAALSLSNSQGANPAEANFDFSNNGLTQASVDALCDQIASAWTSIALGANGTIDFSGGTNAVPSSTQLATLQGLGFNVVTN